MEWAERDAGGDAWRLDGGKIGAVYIDSKIACNWSKGGVELGGFCKILIKSTFTLDQTCSDSRAVC